MSELLHREPASHIAAFRADLRAGRPWTEALLAAIAAWDVTGETVEGREYRYLVGGEAFDWLLLAERLLDAVEPSLLPEAEVEALLLDERWPAPLSEEDFQAALGAGKYRAHLNFTYGVRVEEALQLTVEEEVRKERGNAAFRHDAAHDGDHFQRIYGETRSRLIRDFRAAQGREMVDRISLSELKEFTYWLFKRRLAAQDPARVASDTRRGLLRLQAMEELKRRRRPAPPTPSAAPIIDGIAVAVG
jgi:hypothetical protein